MLPCRSVVPITVNAYRFLGREPLAASAASAVGTPTAPATATPAPVTADFFKNFRRFKDMSASPSGNGQQRA